TRCYYFYDVATPCNKRAPGSGCSAVNGLNRMHAILGTSEACIATHPSDMCVALAALEAKVHVTGPRGERAIAFADFHRLPGDTPERDTNLAHDEIVTAVELPPRGFAANYTYLKIRDRLSYAFALVSIAAAFELEGGTIKEARLALGGVAHKPWRDPAAEAALRGEAANRTSFARAADIVLREARGYAHNAFKIELARRGIVRALTQAAQGMPQSQSDKKIRRDSNDLYRHANVTRRRPRESDGRGEIRRRVQHAGAGARRRGHVEHRQGPHQTHRRQRSVTRGRRACRAHARQPAAHGEERRGLQGRGRAGRLAVPPAL